MTRRIYKKTKKIIRTLIQRKRGTNKYKEKKKGRMNKR